MSIANPAGFSAALAAAPRPWPADLAGSSDAVRLARERVSVAASREGGGLGILLVADRGFDLAAIAREIHGRGRGDAAPFETLDCAADGVERALFGRAGRPAGKAARNEALDALGADARLVAARGGTLLLTSIAELPASAQARLARLLRDGEARVAGSNGARKERLSVRIVATARLQVDADVEEGRLRPELYRRLAGVRIEVASLARRREDIPVVARQVLREVLEAAGAPPRAFTQAALALVAALPWEGNVDELRTVIEGLCRATTPGVGIRVEDVLGEIRLDARPGVLGPQASLREARREFEREYIAAVLRHHGGRMGPAARMLGIQRTNLYRKARQLGIARRKAAE
jgi:DNA-binding NtrC family response regulator